MDDANGAGRTFVCGMLAGILLTMFLAVAFMTPNSVMRTEAVKHGAAHWDTDEYGRTVFTWNDDK